MAQQTENTSPTLSERGLQLFSCYSKLAADPTDEELLVTLLITDNSYFFSQNEARHILGRDGRGKSAYDSDKAALMDYEISDEVDPNIEDQVLHLLAQLINTYLSDKQGPLDLGTQVGRRTMNEVKVLMIQLFNRGIMNIIEPLINIPEYIKPTIEYARENLEDTAQVVFSEFINDLQELGNEHLIDYVTGIGPEVFGTSTESKAGVTYEKWFIEYFTTIKNPSELRSRYLLRRQQYRDYAVEVDKVKLYELFDITANAYNKVQRNLIDQFQEMFNQDESSCYIHKLIIGDK